MIRILQSLRRGAFDMYICSYCKKIPRTLFQQTPDDSAFYFRTQRKYMVHDRTEYDKIRLQNKTQGGGVERSYIDVLVTWLQFKMLQLIQIAGFAFVYCIIDYELGGSNRNAIFHASLFDWPPSLSTE